MAGIEINEIANALRADMLSLCHALGLQGKMDHNDFVAYNPTRNDKHLGSFRICVRGAKQGVWSEFASSESGDAIDLINYCLFNNATNKHEAIEWAKSFLGIGTGEITYKEIRQKAEEQRVKAEEAQKKEAEDFKRYAHKIFLQSEVSIKGTPAQAYFEARQISFARLGKQPRSIRYNPKCYYSKDRKTGQIFYYPAIVTAIFKPNEGFVGVHRTFLEQVDGVWKRKAKKVLGSFAGGAIHLWRGKSGLSIAELAKAKDLDEVDSTLIVCEGIEDGLSIAMACPEYRIWTSISISNMKNIEIPDCIKNIIIAGDCDGDQAIATQYLYKAAETFMNAGKTVKIAMPKTAHDFNDELTGKNYKNS